MEEQIHFTDEESSLSSTQQIHGHTETSFEGFRLPATGTPLCVCEEGRQVELWWLRLTALSS